jgi:hypothetical protein
MDMELPDDFAGSTKALVDCIRAAGLLDMEDVIEMAEPGRTLLLAAGARLEQLHGEHKEGVARFNEGYAKGMEAMEGERNKAIMERDEARNNNQDIIEALQSLGKDFGCMPGLSRIAWLRDCLTRLRDFEQAKPSALSLAVRHNMHEQAIRDGYDQATARAVAWAKDTLNERIAEDMRQHLADNQPAGAEQPSDGLLILRDDVEELESGGLKQWFSVKRPSGNTHYRAIEVVKRMAGAEEDLPQYQLIEARLMRGNR